MAEENELELDNGAKKKKMLIIIIAVVVLAIGGAGAFFFLGGSSEDVSQAELDAALDSSEPAAEAESDSAEMGSALYVPMPRPFRFNVPGSARDRFVEIRVQLLVRGSDNEEEAKKHVPLIESTILNVFSQANADDLGTSAGKTSLKQLALKEVQKIMTEVSSNKIVEQVLFTGFVMQ
ncbi:MAG: flagellar basal body-associated protein FliL [Thalassotalea sp.]